MSLRIIGGRLHYRFRMFGHKTCRATGLRGTPSNREIVRELEMKEREGRAQQIRFGLTELTPKPFDEVVGAVMFALRQKHGPLAKRH